VRVTLYLIFGKEKDLIGQIDLKEMTREEILGQEGLLKQLTEKLLSRVTKAEKDEHFGLWKEFQRWRQFRGQSKWLQ
jgi:hypothetical protein